MPDLKSLIIQRPRETSGSKTQRKFDYQKNWAICKLIELYNSQKDNFVLVLEYHDDIILLDSQENPSKIEFFQIKTKDKGNWTLGTLFKKTPINSPMGKLYLNKLKFGDFVFSLNFVSNAPFELKLSAGGTVGTGKFCVNELKEDLKSKICEKLKKELDILEICSEIVFLEVSDLQVMDHDAHTQGKLAQFIENLSPGTRINIGIIHRALFEEVRRRCNKEVIPRDYESLIDFKGISKLLFNKMIFELIIKKDPVEENWNDICNEISNQDEWSLSKKRAVRSELNKYKIDRMDKTKSLLQRLTEKIKKAIKKLGETEFSSLEEMIKKVLIEYQDEKIEEENLFSEEYIKAIIIMEYYIKDG